MLKYILPQKEGNQELKSKYGNYCDYSFKRRIALDILPKYHRGLDRILTSNLQIPRQELNSKYRNYCDYSFKRGIALDILPKYPGGLYRILTSNLQIPKQKYNLILKQFILLRWDKVDNLSNKIKWKFSPPEIYERKPNMNVAAATPP